MSLLTSGFKKDKTVIADLVVESVAHLTSMISEKSLKTSTVLSFLNIDITTPIILVKKDFTVVMLY